jgi:hypothetical protein
MDGSVKRRLVHAVNWHYWRSIFLVVAMALRCWTPKTDIIAEGAKQIQRKLSVVAQSMAGWEFQSMKQSDNGRFRVNRSNTQCCAEYFETSPQARRFRWRWQRAILDPFDALRRGAADSTLSLPSWGKWRQLLSIQKTGCNPQRHSFQTGA